jgi:hypothetical protein
MEFETIDDKNVLAGVHRDHKELLDTQNSGNLEPMISPVSL